MSPGPQVPRGRQGRHSYQSHYINEKTGDPTERGASCSPVVGGGRVGHQSQVFRDAGRTLSLFFMCLIWGLREQVVHLPSQTLAHFITTLHRLRFYFNTFSLHAHLSPTPSVWRGPLYQFPAAAVTYIVVFVVSSAELLKVIFCSQSNEGERGVFCFS